MEISSEKPIIGVLFGKLNTANFPLIILDERIGGWATVDCEPQTDDKGVCR